MASRDLYLFPDTNFFIQCKDTGELPWDIWADRSLVRLIVCRPVQSEIDNHKGRGNDRVGRRARKAAGILREVIAAKTPKVIRAKGPRVELDVRIALKPSPDLADDLDYSETDDKIVGIAHAFAKSAPDADVMVISADGGPLASAGMVDIAAFPIPDEWLQPPEETPTDKKLKTAQAEIERLRSLEPRFEFGSTGKVLYFERNLYPELTENEIDILVQELIHKNPMKRDFSNNHQRTGNISKLYAEFSVPSADQIDEYRQKYDRWITKSRKILEGIHHLFQMETGLPRFVMTIANVGTRPAKDALVRIIPRGKFALAHLDDEEDDEQEIERLGPPPVAPKGERVFNFVSSTVLRRGQFDIIHAGLLPGLMGGLPSLEPHDPNEFYPRKGDTPADIAFVCDQWRHCVGATVFQGDISPGVEPGVVRGAVECQVHAENLATMAVKTVEIEIVVKTASTFEQARRSLTFPVQAIA